MSMAATEVLGFEAGSKKIMKLDFIDARRAYFHAKSRMQVYVALPQEDGGRDFWQAMHGTREVAQNWECAYV